MPAPKHLQLDGLGPFLAPAVVGFLGLTIAEGRLPVQMRFRLEDGSELHLPIQEAALDKLMGQFAGLHAEAQREEDRS